MKIKTAELKKFKSNSSFVKTNNILPILGYLKFQDGKVTKTNLNSFIIQEIDFKGEFLVDENILFNFLNYTSEPTIDISVKDNKIVISDGKSKVSSPTEDINNFPKMPEPTSERYELPTEVFTAVHYSANFVDNMDLPDMRAHVFIGNKLVAGCNGFIGYAEKFKEELPKIVLPKDTAATIGKFSMATFSENEKFMFFDTDNCQYCFIKSIYPFADLSKICVLDKKQKNFTIDKNEILSFADMCVSSTKAKGLVANLSMKAGKINLLMSDADFQVDVNKSIKVEGEVEGDFNFNPALMATLLKNLPDNDLIFYRSPAAYIVTGESGFVSIIQQLA